MRKSFPAGDGKYIRREKMEFQIRTDNIHLRSDGRWEVKYAIVYDEGALPDYGYICAESYEEARAAVLRLLSYSTPKEKPPAPPEKGNYGDCLDEWLEFIRPRVKESTYIRYMNHVNKHIKPHLGNILVSRLGTACVEEFVSGLLREGKLNGVGGLSPKTVSDIMMVVRESFRYSASHGIDPRCNLEHLVIKKENREMRVLSRYEEHAFVSVLKEDTDRAKAGMLLALYTGIRLGELCALRWKDVSVDEGIVSVSSTMQRLQKSGELFPGERRTHIVTTTPKSSAARRLIPIPAFVANILEDFRSHGNTYLLTGKGTRFAEPRMMQYRFKKYVKLSGIRDANFHALRHTFATRCIEAGVDVKSLSEILGHASVKITLDKYVHSTIEQKRMNMERLFTDRG